MQRHQPVSLTGSIHRLVQLLVCSALVLALFPQTSVRAEPNACPPAPAELPNLVERTEFCVYYNTANTSDAQATTVADHIQAYWDRYETDFGFVGPLYAGKLEVRLLNNAGCNGGTNAGINFLTINNGCFMTAEMIQQVSGHELFHRVQLGYGDDLSAGLWLFEGTARMMEDETFDNIDNWTGALAVPFSFNRQVNEYLLNPNVDITSDPQRYNSALWWKYFAEQFGTILTEPQRGVDAIRALWEATGTENSIAAVNLALTNLSASTNFDTAFRRFVAANWLKDLTNEPDTAFNYVDEEQVGNPAPYGPIVPTNGGTISVGTAAVFNDQSLNRYGARYYSAVPSSTDCPVVSAHFHTDSGPAFYHIITQKGSALDSHIESVAGDVTRSFFNDGLTRVVAIAGSTNNSAQADITLECVNPVIEIKLPNNGAVANVGPHNGPGKFLAQILVHNGSPTGPVVAGLTTNDFKARVNGQNALINAGGFIQQQYWLVVTAPNQTADGVYDLEVVLEKSGTTTPIASDTNVASISYNTNHVDQVLVIDRSGSMSADNKMVAARQAARFYVDISRNNDGVGVVAYNEDVNPAPYTLRAVTGVPNVRQEAKDYIDTLNAGGLTSIGDGMAEAVNQHNSSPTANPLCSYVLLSDGMENSAQFWADVQAGVIATHCPVTSIALGAASDEVLMQNIATATGGLFFYNDVFTGAAAASADAVAQEEVSLGLGDVYEYSQAGSEGRQRLFQQEARIKSSFTISQEHKVLVDDSVSEALFALDWDPGRALELILRQPDGTLIDSSTLPYTFADFSSGHVGWRIPSPQPGEWTMIVRLQPQEPIPLAANTQNAEPDGTSPDTAYQVIASGRSNLNADLLLPDRLGSRYFTGNRVPIFAFVTGQGPLGGLHPIAVVTAPDGSERNIPLFDDGQHGDGDPDDGLYGGLYTTVNQANAVAPTGEQGQEPTPNDEGSYRVRLIVQGGTFNREALGSFAVQEGPDANANQLPDPYEEENHVVDNGGDPDLDGIDNLTEYQLGTDPQNSDTDGGGENDGSEFEGQNNPFDPSDDGIVAPQFLAVKPNVGLNVVTYDVRPEYNSRILFRATSPDGPWNVQQPELPVTGVYSDTADNDVTYYYRYMAVDAGANRTAVIGSTGVMASADPFAPEATVLIDGGAPTTSDLEVKLNFQPYGEDEATFADITEMKLSNLPDLSDAGWQPFTQDVPWQLAPTSPGEETRVYARVRDAAQNESLLVFDDIQVTAAPPPTNPLFLPLVVGQQ